MCSGRCAAEEQSIEPVSSSCCQLQGTSAHALVSLWSDLSLMLAQLLEPGCMEQTGQGGCTWLRLLSAEAAAQRLIRAKGGTLDNSQLAGFHGCTIGQLLQNLGQQHD
ncbi:hypothetical protein HaLaN_05769, partial [Haematococcus lacustris]